MNSDDQKITWKSSSNLKGSTVNTKNADIPSSAPQKLSQALQDDINDLGIRSGDQRIQSKASMNESSSAVSSLRAEIDAALNDASEKPTTSRDQDKLPIDAPVFNTAPEPFKDKVSAPQIPEISKIPTTNESSGGITSAEKTESSQEFIDKLKNEIKTDLSQSSAVPKDNEQSHVDMSPENPLTSTPETESTIPSDLGVEHTYYSDLSNAMSSNEPATMSELIKRSRHEKKTAAIASPRSAKNILFLIGSGLLVIAAFFVLFSFFKPQQKVEFISQEKVSSLVSTNQDTGINVTGLQEPILKEAIRKVVEQKIPTDTINQIYYVLEDGADNLRRLGLKDVFERTDNQVPELLYDNIENNFTHGVYKTDKNYPFMILKAKSYDRALLGMKEWEPTMIDDLATYFDLPPEATDRSLIQDGFEDDLIRNKNVRVVRFLPREVDRRGILQLLNRNSASEPVNEEEGDENLIPNIFSAIGQSIKQSLGDYAFAQNTRQVKGIVTDQNAEVLPGASIKIQGTSFGGVAANDGTFQVSAPDGSQVLEFSFVGYTTATKSIGSGDLTDISVQLQEDAAVLGQVTVTGSKNTNTTNGVSFDNLASDSVLNPDGIVTTGGEKLCYLSKRCMDSDGNEVDISRMDIEGITCVNDVQSGPNDRVFDASYEGTPGYACFDTLEGSEEISQISRTAPVCFDEFSGRRLTDAQQSQLGGSPEYPEGFCFPSYECRKYECFDENNKVVPSTEQGKPGVMCRETNELVPHNWTGEDGKGRKMCRQFTSLLLLDNINNSLLCFDEFGTYLPNQASSDAGLGIACITPQSRAQQICIDSNYQLTDPGSGAFCFSPMDEATVPDIAPNQCRDLPANQLKAQAADVATKLKFLAALVRIAGMDSVYVNYINNASNFLYQYAFGNILEQEAVRTGALIVQQLEQILDILDPNQTLPDTGPNGGLSIFGYLRGLIHVTKCSLGIADSLTWETLNQLPQGYTIYAGETVDGVSQIQQALVLTGLMDPVSVTGRLDLVTQDALAEFQSINGLPVTGIADDATLELIGVIQAQQGAFYNGDEALVNEYIIMADGQVGQGQVLKIGSYSNEVQSLQSILRAEGYAEGVGSINTGLFDARTCEALRAYQSANNFELAEDPDCRVSTETLKGLNDLIAERGWLEGEAITGSSLDGDGVIGGGQNVSDSSLQVYDYFSIANQINGDGEYSLALGAYNENVQRLQLVLYAEGYDIPVINGLYDNTTCSAVQSFEQDNNLETSSGPTCSVLPSTIETLNDVIRENNYLGSGFGINDSGILIGIGEFEGTFGPGTIDFTNQAEADSLKEGDIVLMYMFLDEETILIVRDELVIDEIIRRRAFSDIFN